MISQTPEKEMRFPFLPDRCSCCNDPELLDSVQVASTCDLLGFPVWLAKVWRKWFIDLGLLVCIWCAMPRNPYERGGCLGAVNLLLLGECSPQIDVKG